MKNNIKIPFLIFTYSFPSINFEFIEYIIMSQTTTATKNKYSWSIQEYFNLTLVCFLKVGVYYVCNSLKQIL